jgi:hypothetical protein
VSVRERLRRLWWQVAGVVALGVSAAIVVAVGLAIWWSAS